MEIYALKHH